MWQYPWWRRERGRRAGHFQPESDPWRRQLGWLVEDSSHNHTGEKKMILGPSFRGLINSQNGNHWLNVAKNYLKISHNYSLVAKDMATALKGLHYNYFPIFPVARLLLVQTEETNLRQERENNPWEMQSALACDCYRPCKAPRYPPTDLPRWCRGKEPACLFRTCKRWRFDPSSKIPWSRKWQPIPVFLPGKFHGTEEPGGLQSMGSQRVGYDWVPGHAHTHTHHTLAN